MYTRGTMNRTLAAVAGLAALYGVAGARHQGNTLPSLLKRPPITHHVFPPLTLAQKLAAVKLFRLKLAPTSGNPVYTLTPQAAFSSPLQASLNVDGNWLTAPGTNYIALMGTTLQEAWVVLANPDPTKAYLVTFNVSVHMGGPVTLTMQYGKEEPVNVFPTVTLSSPWSPNPGPATSVPIVLPSGNSAAVLTCNVSAYTEFDIESVTIEQL